MPCQSLSTLFQFYYMCCLRKHLSTFKNVYFLWFVEVLYTIWMLILFKLNGWQIFSHWCGFTMFMVSFSTKVLHFIQSNVSVFSFVICAFCVLFMKFSSTHPMSLKYYPVFTSIIFWNFCVSYLFLIRWNWMCLVWEEPNFIFFKLSQQHLFNSWFFPVFC